MTSTNDDARQIVFVHLDYGRSLDAWQHRYANGQAWDPSPYGYSTARGYFRVAFSRDRPERRVRSFVRRATRRLAGFDLVHALDNAREFLAADVIWTHTEHEHLAVSAVLLFLRKKHRPKLIAQSVWLWDRWEALSPPKRYFYRRLLHVANVHTTHSPVNLAFARSTGLPNVRLLPYGASGPAPLERPERAQGSSIAVVAPGNDRNRDWPTLLRAAELDDHLSITIATKTNGMTSVPVNVSVRAAETVAQLTNLYANADVVAVPLSSNMHASGFTVIIEGLLSGRPIVATDTGGLSEIFGDLVNFVPLGDPRAFAEALVKVGREGRSSRPGSVEARGLTAQDFVRRHVLLTYELLDNRPPDADVSRLEHVQVGEDDVKEARVESRK